MDKEMFDKKVAAIWSVYTASKTLNDAGVSTRSNLESVQALLRKATAEIGETLASAVGA